MTREIKNIIDNQNGSLMVIAFLIMATLAVAGLLVTNDAIMESRVNRNFAVQKLNVSTAEGAGKELIQAIDIIFENAASAPDAVAGLTATTYTPVDGYNSTFNFNQGQWDVTGFYPIKNSNLESNVSVGYVFSADAFAVLVDQSTAAMTPGLGGAKVPEYFTYVIYCRGRHRLDQRENTPGAILMIGYRQEKV